MSCVDEILAAASRAGIQLPEEEAKEIVDILNDRLSKRISKATEDEYLDIYNLAKEIARQARINAVIEKRNRLLNAKAYATAMAYINKTGKNQSERLSALMVGSAKFGLNSSVGSKQHGIMLQYTSELAAALRSKGLENIFKSGELDEKIFEAMFDLDKFVATTDADKAAKEIAEIAKKIQNRLLKRKNRNGAVIAEIENYIVRQSHDPILLRAGAKTEAEVTQARNSWVEFMLGNDANGNPRLDAKTFENKPAVKEITTPEGKKEKVAYTERMFLEDIWNNLVSGQHQKVSALRGDDGSIDSIEAFKGPANLAKKLSQSRVLHFSSGKAAYEYANKYTRMSFSEALINGITHDAQAIGLMETFGSNPEAMFTRLLNDIKEGVKDQPLLLDKIKEKRLKNQFAELDGSTRARGAGRPVLFGADFAGISAAWRMLQNMAKLGMATISSFGDIATKATFINSHTERGIFGSYATAIGDVFRAIKTSEEQKQLAYLLNVGVEAMLGDVHARFGTNDSGPGMIAKAHQVFFRLNGMNWWNNAQKVGVARILSADLANYAGRAFSDIPERTRFSLERYGITESDWAVLSTVELNAADGNNYMTASGVMELSDDALRQAALDKANATRKRKLKQPTQAMIDKYRDELSTKIATYFTDSADTAIPTPGAKERALMNQGTERGTVLGEAIRAIMQLKGFPISYVSKGLSAQYYAKKQLGKSGMFGVAQMMVGTTMMGYLSVSMKDILKGKEPLDVFDDEYILNPELLTKAFVQGGGAGIYGDFLFGEYNKYGQTLTQTLAGPTFGTIDDIAKIYSNVMAGDTDALTRDATRFAISNTPGLNLFYTKAAMDYLFIYALMEKTNPGYLRRMERRMRKDMEQEFYFPPSQYATKL